MGRMGAIPSRGIIDGMTRRLPPRGQPGNPGKFRASTTGGADPARYQTDMYPEYSIREAAHIGTFDRADKTEDSYEGNGVSVSVHPDDWAEIARLPDPVWTLTNDNGKPFSMVDAHRLDEGLVSGYATRNGYATETVAWTVPIVDENGEDAGQFTVLDHDEAVYEADGATPARTSALVATEKLARRTGATPGTVAYPEHLTVVWAEDRTDADGVWWDDTHDPVNLSAPRGTIFDRTTFTASPGWESS